MKQVKRFWSGNQGAAVIGMLLLVAFGICLGYFLWHMEDEKQEDEPLEKKTPNYSIEKQGAAALADFTAKTRQIHGIVDGVLRETEASILDIKETNKTINRQKAEGSIRYNNREIPVSMTQKQQAEFKAALAKRLAKIDAGIFAQQPDVFGGQAAMRYDIGIQDALEGEDLEIISDRIYVIEKVEQLPEAKGTQPKQRRALKEGQAKLALIIDDFGYAAEPIEAYARIHRPLTFAVLPAHPHSVEAAKRGHLDGRTILLHLPMEAVNPEASEEALTLHANASESRMRAAINELTEAVPYIEGVNNHQGSRVTSDTHAMRIVLKALEEKGLFFVDSRTSGGSVAYAVAREMGVPAAENLLFIDNDAAVEKIKYQLQLAARLALQHGEAVAIGHARLPTAQAIQESIPDLEAQGIRLVSIKEVLQ